MAILTAVRERARDDWPVAVGVGAAIVAVAVLRTVLFGWAPVAPDDARYLFVGLSILGGDGPVIPSGQVFLVRSPVYPIVLAVGSTIVGGDPLLGARVMDLGLAVACLFGAVRLGWLLAGRGGAIGTTIALFAMPIIWRLVGTLLIDLPQTAGVIAVLLAAWSPTMRRWALAGLLFGLTILVKESVLPLALLPLAMLGFEPTRHVARLTAVYLGAALLTAGWWWVVVWLGAHVLFPLNALEIIAGRDVAVDIRITWPALVLFGLVAAAWLAMVVRARTDRGVRLLVTATACLLPAALYAFSQGLNARNYAGLAVMSSVALGVAGVSWVGWIRRRLDRREGGVRTVSGRRRALTASLIAVLSLGVVGGVVLGQRAASRPASANLTDELATWLRANTIEGDRVVMSFRDRELMALRLFGLVQFRTLFATKVEPADDLASYLWLGIRDRTTVGYKRSAWTAALTKPPARYLAVSGPHPYTPTDLAASITAGRAVGLAPAVTFDDGGNRVQVFTVDAATVPAGLDAIRMHATAEAATAWLDLAVPADGEDGAVARLLAVEPIVSGTGLDDLLARLGDAACVSPEDLSAGPRGAPVTAVGLRPAEACRG